MSEPPGLPRVVALLTRAALRRFWNRISSNLAAQFRGAKRRATPRRGGRSLYLLIFMGLWFGYVGLTMSTQIVGTLAAEVEGGQGEPALLPGPSLWVDDESREPELVAALGGVLTVLGTVILLYGLGMGNTDLSQVGWTMEWLFTFPVASRGLFAAKIGEYALASVFGWVTVLPLLLTTYLAAGWGGWAVPAAVAGTLYVGVLIGAVRVVCETALRKRLPPHRVRDVQASFTVLATLLFLAIAAAAQFVEAPGGLLRALRGVPAAVAFSPLAAPIRLVASPSAAAVTAAWLGAFALGGPLLCERMVRSGLVGARAATRRGGRRGGRRAGRVGGILSKELRVVLRDRNFMVQTLVVPILLGGFYALMLSDGVGGRGALYLAYAVAAYALMFSAFGVVASEGQAIWLLYTLPRPLHAVLRRKALLWGTAAAAYAVAVLAAFWRPADGGWLEAALIAPAVYLLSFLAAGIAAVATDPLQEKARQIPPEWSLLYMLLAGGLGAAIFVPALWPKIVLTALMALLVHATWERARDRLPLLLDPVARPKPVVALSDGLVAVILFFGLHVALHAAMSAFGAFGSESARLLASYAAAGCAIAAATLYSFWRLGVPDLLRTLGLRPGLGAPPPGRSLALGVAAGAAAGGVGLLYLAFAPVPAREVPADWFLVALAVVAAPLVEELIFRGVLLAGMRRTMRTPVAVAATAVVFAIVHEPHAVPPVLVLGLAAGTVHVRTRLLWSAVAAHATYNAVVML